MKKNKINIKNIIDITIKVLIIFLIGLAICNIFLFKDNLQYSYNYKFIIIFDIIYLFLIFGIIHLKNRVKFNISITSKKIIKYLGILLVLIVQVAYALIICRKIGFDSGIIYDSAIDLMNGNLVHEWYFSMYENNIFLTLFIEILFRIFRTLKLANFFFIGVLFNILIIDLAIYYIYKICKILFENKYSFICNLFSLPMLGFTPYIAVVYSDTLSLIFPLLIFYNYLCYKKSDDKKYKLKRIAFITLFTIIGYLVKPTNVIILIAILILEIFYSIINHFKDYRNILKDKYILNYYLKCIFIVFFIFIAVYGSFILYKDLRLKNYISKQDFQNNGFPYTHFMMMGLKPTDMEGKYYGYYSEDDVNETKLRIGKEEKKEYNISEIRKRLKKLGFSGYISFLYDKYTCIISDGSFFYGMEGNFYTSDPYSNSKFSKLVQKYTYQSEDGYNNVTVNIMQAYWSLILIIILLSTIKCIFKNEENYINILRLSLIGIILFILLFEARSRYLINHIPIFIILCVYGITNIYNLKQNKNVVLLKDKT